MLAYSAPAVADGTVCTVSADGTLSAFDAAGSRNCSVAGTAKTCSPLWSAVTGSIGGGSPAIVNGVPFINVQGGATVYAYSR